MSKTTNKFSTEVRARAVRMVLDHEGDYPSRWSAIGNIPPAEAEQNYYAAMDNIPMAA